MSEKLTDLLDCLPPVARGDRVSVPRETYERVRLAIAELAAAEARGRAAALAGCVPVPRELFARVVTGLDEALEGELIALAAELRALPGSEGNEATA